MTAQRHKPTQREAAEQVKRKGDYYETYSYLNRGD